MVIDFVTSSILKIGSFYNTHIFFVGMVSTQLIKCDISTIICDVGTIQCDVGII
jgi:hypothetical protein